MRVTVLGGAAWNRMIQVDRLPEGPATIRPRWHHETIGGAGAGKAMNLARLGVDAFFPGTLFGVVEGVALEPALGYGARAAALAITSTELASRDLTRDFLQAQVI